MSAQTHHRHTTVDGLDVFYREAGDPQLPTVVLLHGAPASSYMFRELIPLLAAEYHVIAPDYIGFGLSAAPDVTDFEYTFDHLTDVTEGLLQQLGVDSFALYVQDYGAPVGWRLFVRDPSRVTAIVSQNGNAYEQGFVDDFWAPLWRYAADHNSADEAILLDALSVEKIRWQYTHGLTDPSVVSPDSWLHDFTQVNRPGNPAVQLALFADYPTNRALYPTLHDALRNAGVPLLAIWGENDEIFGPDGARAFSADLPDADIVLLDGGHFLLESHLEAVASNMVRFLGAHVSTSASVSA
ncbi:alpha/beta fold hydrolase [Subtercola lobariae]|uniref:Hydrolase n=1 Tax=Subtercola lobariae TaxID=1588641 RepID=A0A917F0U0_9MICO|nr:alpha/beta hydrolase [Subtercola lobariae]GGF31556.1 hydrolase [Subtercola lobariae]